MKLKFKWNVFIYLLLFCGLLLLILWLFQIVFLQPFYQSIRLGEVKNSANIVSKNINHQDLGSLLKQLSSENEVSIQIVDENGTVVAASGDIRGSVLSLMNREQRQEISEKVHKNGGKQISYLAAGEYHGDDDDDEPEYYDPSKFEGDVPRKNYPKPETVIYGLDTRAADEQTLTIFVNGILQPVNATVSALSVQLLIVTVIILALAVLIALLLARKVSKPIEQINKSAKVLATGNYEADFHATGFREIEELADTLNHTAGELAKVDSFRRELMANVSHDLRTPLTLIYGCAEVIHDFPQESAEENAQIIMDETQRLSSFVSDILELSRYEDGENELKTQEYDLTQSIKDATKRMAALTDAEGYQITFEADGEVFVVADEAKISQAFYNLLVNAVHYTGEDGRVAVKQTATGARVRISVTDTGNGVDAEHLPYIWDRYYKADKTHKRAVHGTGLGLSIVKKLITLHGGTYGVDVTPAGSTFWFELPIAPETE